MSKWDELKKKRKNKEPESVSDANIAEEVGMLGLPKSVSMDFCYSRLQSETHFYKTY